MCAKGQLKCYIRDVCTTVSLAVSFALKCIFLIIEKSKLQQRKTSPKCLILFFLDSQPTHATYHEIPQSKASFLIGFLSVGSLAGRLLFGHVSDYRCVNRMYLYQSAFLIMAVTTTLCPLYLSECRLFVYDDTESWTSSTGRKKRYGMIKFSQRGKKETKEN